MSRFRLLLLGAVVAMAAIPVTLALAAGPTPPTAVTTHATNVGKTSAILNGTVNPNGTAAGYEFQYGPTAAYGEETAMHVPLAGASTQPAFATVSNLLPGRTYHFRLLANSGAGVAVGSDETFKTAGTAPPAAPLASVNTATATSVTGNSATVNGSLDPKGQPTTYYFEYGETTDYGSTTTPVGLPAGTGPGAVNAALGNLAANVTYHYRLVALSPTGVALGADRTFTTTLPAQATTASASSIDYSSATLNGTVNPQGNPTQYYFQYGSTPAYGLQTAPQSAGSGSGPVSVGSKVTGLMANSAYHYRLVATNSGGTVYGADQLVTTTAAVSTVRLMGHMGFVSPGYVVGVEIGCFGPSQCSGTFKARVNGQLIGSGKFKENAHTGAFRNIKLNARGIQLLRGNHANHLLNVNIDVAVDGGQTINGSLSFATWYWKDAFKH